MRYLVPIGLATGVVFTVSLMITSHALPRWYTISVELPIGPGKTYFYVGIWKLCSPIDMPGLRAMACLDIHSGSLDIPGLKIMDAALEISESFASIAVILVGLGALGSVLIEVQGTKAHRGLLQAPRILFGLSASTMAIAASSFISKISMNTTPLLVGGKYDASFFIAWASVATGMLAAVFAHLHHTSKSKHSAEPSVQLPLDEYQERVDV